MADTRPLLFASENNPELDDDIEVGLTMRGDLNFEDVVNRNPEAVLSFLSKQGTRMLGTFKIEVRMSSLIELHIRDMLECMDTPCGHPHLLVA